MKAICVPFRLERNCFFVSKMKRKMERNVKIRSKIERKME